MDPILAIKLVVSAIDEQLAAYETNSWRPTNTGPSDQYVANGAVKAGRQRNWALLLDFAVQSR